MKAVVLLSGGLDSSLALRLILDQGVEVIVLHFSSPFCRCDGTRACGFFARNMADQVGVEVKTMYLGASYLEIVKNPKYGYGKNLNPCIDCRIQKFRKAKEVMNDTGASFVVTGEVVGQRPMSQHKRAMAIIEKESKLEDLVVRPLSAQRLAPSLPERNGWVKRKAFLSLQGRTRKPQIKLAEDLDIKNYPCPAGGCLLTDASFAKRMRDLLTFGTLDLNNVELLKIGRHFRLSPESKLIVGRDEKENHSLLHLAREEDIVLEPVADSGPTAVIRGNSTESDRVTSSKIIARYTSYDKEVKVSIKGSGFRYSVTERTIEENTLAVTRI